MRHFYTLLLFMLATTMPMHAYEVIVNFDNPQAVTVYKGNSDWKYQIEDFKQYPVVEISQGENTLDINGYLWIVANEGYLITEKSETGNSYKDILPQGGAWSYVYQAYSTTVTRSYSVTTTSTDKFFDSSFTLKCDDFTKIREANFNDQYTLSLELPGEGVTEMTVPFSSEYYTTLSFAKNNSSFYKIIVDNVEIDNPGSYYTLELAGLDGKEVELLCNYPEIECNVKISFVNEGTEACVASIRVDDEKLENIDFNNITVMCGSNLSMNFDSDMYDIKSVIFNGTEKDTWGFYDQILTDSEIIIEAEKYPVLTKQIYVEGAEFISLGKGNYERENTFNLTDGYNTYEYSAANPYVYLFDMNEDYYMAELTDNGNDISFSKWGTSISLEPEGELRIILGKINRDKQVIIYLDSQLDSDTHQGNCFWLKDNNYRYVTSALEPGYNTVDFCDADGIMTINWSNARGTKDNLYINDVKQTAPGGYKYSFTPSHNDIVKVYLDSDPEPVQLSFETVGDDVQAEGVKDIVSPVDLNSTYSVLPGTKVNIKATGTDNLLVNVGDNSVANVESHEFTVTKDTHVTIRNYTTSGVENVATDTINENSSVYNLQGVKVATKAQMSNLPKGIYIVDGKKIVK